MRLAIIDDLLFVGEKFCSDQTYLGSTITDFSCYGQFLHPSKLLLSELQYIQSTYGKHGDRNICRHRKWPRKIEAYACVVCELSYIVIAATAIMRSQNRV